MVFALHRSNVFRLPLVLGMICAVLALQAARKRESSGEFEQEYARRAGVEGAISQGVRACGLRRARYVGEAKVHL